MLNWNPGIVKVNQSKLLILLHISKLNWWKMDLEIHCFQQSSCIDHFNLLTWVLEMRLPNLRPSEHVFAPLCPLLFWPTFGRFYPTLEHLAFWQYFCLLFGQCPNPQAEKIIAEIYAELIKLHSMDHNMGIELQWGRMSKHVSKPSYNTRIIAFKQQRNWAFDLRERA